MNNADLTVSVRVLWKHRTHRLYGSCECVFKGWKYKALSPRAAAAAGAESLPTLKEQSAATWLHTWNSEDWSLHLSGASSASASWASGLMLRDTSPSGCHTFLGLSQSTQVDNQPTLIIILFHYVIEKKGEERGRLSCSRLSFCSYERTQRQSLKQLNSVGLGAWRILFLFLNLSRKQKFLPEWIPSLCVDLENWIIASITQESIVNCERAVSLHLLSYLFLIHSFLLWLNRKVSLFLGSRLTWQFCLHNQRKKNQIKLAGSLLQLKLTFILLRKRIMKVSFLI